MFRRPLAKRIPDDLSSSDSAFYYTVTQCLAGLTTHVHTVIFSCEMLGQQLLTENSVVRLKKLLLPFFSDFIIVTYLRRQDEVAVSKYSTSLRNGELHKSLLSGALDYHHVLSIWSEVFGYGAIRPRLYQKSPVEYWDLIEDFISTASLPLSTNVDESENINSSLNGAAQIFLCKLAKQIKIESPELVFKKIFGYGILRKSLNEQFSGVGLLPTRIEAYEYFAAFRESNELVRKIWFPDLLELFVEGFDVYPAEEQTQMSDKEVLEVAMTVIVDIVTKGADLKIRKRSRNTPIDINRR